MAPSMEAEKGDVSPMNICVFGLWHLGTVTAACLAEAGYTVVATDPDEVVVASLIDGTLPVAEPGLQDVISAAVRAGRLGFSSDGSMAVRGADVVWVTFDTPVDDD